MITTCPDCGRDFHLRLSDPEKEPDCEPNTQPCFPCWKKRNSRADRAEAVSIMASLLRLLREYESAPSRTLQGSTELVCPLCFRVYPGSGERKHNAGCLMRETIDRAWVFMEGKSEK